MGTNFDEFIKQSSEQFSDDGLQANWADLEKRLDKTMPVQKGKGGNLWVLGAGSIIALLSLWFWLNHRNEAVSVAQNPSLEASPYLEKDVQLMAENKDVNKENRQIAENESRLIDNSTQQATNEHQEPTIHEALTLSSVENLKTKEVPSEKQINPSLREVAPKQQLVKKDQPGDYAFKTTYKKEACQGEVVTFFVEPACAECVFEWTLGDGTVLKGQKVSYAFEDQGKFPISVQVRLEEQQLDFKNFITIHPTPKGEISIKEDFSGPFPEYIFSAGQEDLYSVTYGFSDGQKIIKNTCKRSFYHKRYEPVQVKLVTDKGCKVEFTENVYIEHPVSLLAPNSFSPNGDGRNDTWMPAALQENPWPFTLQIIDAASKTLAYSTSNGNQAWDGKIQSTNKMAKMGQGFVWVATVKMPNQETRTFQGEIMVVE